jgi:nucleotide-binding universal stress UspA family protein
MGRDRKHRIVVGVEGSAGSRAALRWAIDEARYRNCGVEIVTAYLPTYIPAAPDFGYVPLDPIDLAGEVRKMQDDAVAEASASAGDHAVPGALEQRLIKGRAADTLIAAAEGADLLVVGNRGRGGFRGLLLGSVSQQIAQHAGCPVVIVRPDMVFDGPASDDPASDDPPPAR